MLPVVIGSRVPSSFFVYNLFLVFSELKNRTEMVFILCGSIFFWFVICFQFCDIRLKSRILHNFVMHHENLRKSDHKNVRDIQSHREHQQFKWRGKMEPQLNGTALAVSNKEQVDKVQSESESDVKGYDNKVQEPAADNVVAENVPAVVAEAENADQHAAVTDEFMSNKGKNKVVYFKDYKYTKLPRRCFCSPIRYIANNETSPW